MVLLKEAMGHAPVQLFLVNENPSQRVMQRRRL
jgi:hypothetical protein